MNCSYFYNSDFNFVVKPVDKSLNDAINKNGNYNTIIIVNEKLQNKTASCRYYKNSTSGGDISDGSSSRGLSGGAIAGIGIASVVVVVAVVIVAIILKGNGKKPKFEEFNNSGMGTNSGFAMKD